jgi:indole-3-glycerol phosphate synthase
MAPGFLDEILPATRAAVRSVEYRSGWPSAPPGPRPSLRAAIEQQAARGALLVEYKRASPGRAEPNLPYRPVADFVRATERDGVAGYSCLATRHRFDGSLSDVRDLVRATARPVLFKDFVVEPVQLEAARRCGASAVLLIARLETEGRLDRSLASLAEQAHALGLEVLLEFHRRSELSAASGVAADMYGVNVRDLDSLRLDRESAAATIAAARTQGLRPLLGLSGVEGPAAAARFWSAGVDGILVGTGVARAADPAGFLARLTRAERGGRE